MDAITKQYRYALIAALMETGSAREIKARYGLIDGEAPIEALKKLKGFEKPTLRISGESLEEITFKTSKANTGTGSSTYFNAYETVDQDKIDFLADHNQSVIGVILKQGGLD